jgi:hypothetical protein
VLGLDGRRAAHPVAPPGDAQLRLSGRESSLACTAIDVLLGAVMRALRVLSSNRVEHIQ